QRDDLLNCVFCCRGRKGSDDGVDRLCMRSPYRMTSDQEAAITVAQKEIKLRITLTSFDSVDARLTGGSRRCCNCCYGRRPVPLLGRPDKWGGARQPSVTSVACYS